MHEHFPLSHILKCQENQDRGFTSKQVDFDKWSMLKANFTDYRLKTRKT